MGWVRGQGQQVLAKGQERAGEGSAKDPHRQSGKDAAMIPCGI